MFLSTTYVKILRIEYESIVVEIINFIEVSEKTQGRIEIH
jgi:hypothetical protein